MRCLKCKSKRKAKFFVDRPPSHEKYKFCDQCDKGETSVEQIRRIESEARKQAMIEIVQDHSQDYAVKYRRYLRAYKRREGIEVPEDKQKWSSLGMHMSSELS